MGALWFQFFVLGLIAWRLTHLFSKEDGPFDLIYKLRKKAGAGFFGNLLDCFYCLSLWIALPLGLWLGQNWWERTGYWLALSGLACLLERVTDKTDPPAFFKED